MKKAQREPATVGKLTRRKGVMGGAWVIAGTRIQPEVVFSFHEAGYSVKAILREYPSLEATDVLRAVSFCKAKTSGATSVTPRGQHAGRRLPRPEKTGTSKRKPAPLSRWRLLAQGPGDRYLHMRALPMSKQERGYARLNADTWLKDAPYFDELVVDGFGLHIEAMSDRNLFIGIGDLTFALTVDRDGKLELLLQEGEFDPADGTFHPHGWRKKEKGKRR